MGLYDSKLVHPVIASIEPSYSTRHDVHVSGSIDHNHTSPAIQAMIEAQCGGQPQLEHHQAVDAEFEEVD
jgi:hypothetical protein